MDDADGNRWESVDTGTSEVTVQVGDTVEWRFEWGTAGQEHDLTSVDTASGTWEPAVQEYRVPDDPQGPVRHTFTEPGVYHYLCSIHGTMMTGTVVVEDAGAANTPPSAEPVVDPRTGTAPLVVHFTANGTDADGDPLTYQWDFGTGDGPSDVSSAGHAMHEYTTPGAYTATLDVSDGRGGTHHQEFPITVNGPGPLPGITAAAAPSSGTAPLTVALSAEVSTGGRFKAFAAGLVSYPALTGTAAMVRRRGATYASLDVSGLKPNAHHMVHVHEEPCASNNGGAHFRFDETRPFAEENELWLPFHSDAQGRSGLVEVTQPQRAGADAVSIVIHDPDNPAQRIGCVDLVPHTHDLTYAWDFGDGTHGQGADTTHTYAAGSWTATLTVTDGHGNKATETVAVTTTSAQTPPPPAPVDTVPPQTGIVGGPSGTVWAHHATFAFTSTEASSRFSCSLDGGSWQGCPGQTTYRGLKDGRHRLEVRATDGSGNTDPTPAVRAWTVDTTGPRIRRVRPSVTSSDRTPTVRAWVADRLSAVRRVVLRLDGERVRQVRHDARRGRMTWTPRRSLTTGPHTVRLVAVDAAGNRSARTWRFRVTS